MSNITRIWKATVKRSMRDIIEFTIKDKGEYDPRYIEKEVESHAAKVTSIDLSLPGTQMECRMVYLDLIQETRDPEPTMI